jgi:hypothetical protein
MDMSGTKSRFREQYKRNVLVSNGAGKYIRAKKLLEDRRASRVEHFSRQRDVTDIVTPSK